MGKAMGRKNFSDRERNKLLSIVKNFKWIVDNTRINNAMIAKKKMAWNEIAMIYNTSDIAEYQRTPKQLQTAYQNYKRNLRKGIMVEKPTDSVVTVIEVDPAATEIEVKKEIDPDDQSCSHSIGDDAQKSVLEDQQNPSPCNYYSTSESSCSDEMDDDALNFPLTMEARNLTKNVTPSTIKQSTKKHKNITESTARIKRLYYKKKLQAASIEKQTNMVNYKIALRKAKIIEMEFKIKQIELKSKFIKREV